jgi:type I restriction-modification system DNA methylase subunit
MVFIQLTKEQAKEEVISLIKKYNKIVEEGKFKSYNEEMTKKDFILPLFRSLGWNTEDSNEVNAEEKISKKRVDYGFRINGIPKFFLEAKSLKEDLDNPKFIEQAINYAWHKGCTWAILTDFESVKIFNAEWKTSNPLQSHLKTIPCQEFLDRFNELWLLSKESFEQGLIDKEAEKWGKKTKKISVDKQLLTDFTRFRELLSKNITKLNQNRNITEEDLDESIQRILDRLIFIRNCEDRELEEKTLISSFRECESRGRGQLIKSLRENFAYFDNQYNSKIFASHLCDNLNIDSEVLHEILEGLYFTKDKSVSYDFSAIEADVLGNIYEQYLGHILKKSEKRAKLTENHAHRKEQGIYYTPTYIVDYIVRNTLGELLKDKKVNADKIRILDPACGSGSFLIKGFDILNEHYFKKDKNYSQTQMDFKTGLPFTSKVKILKNNIFGVDLDKQAVEIAQLNLLLKIAERGHRLPLLQENIKCGNSLIDNSNVAGDKAFNWNEKFKQIMDEGGFDVVVGNPPYFNIKSDDLLKKSKDIGSLSAGVVNSASLFLKKGIDLLKENGYLGFIIPKSFLIVDSWKPIRRIILENFELLSVYDVSMAFEEVGLEQVVIVLKKSKPQKNKVKILKNGKEINLIYQSFFKEKDTILTSLDKEKYSITTKIENNSINLGKIADMPRGVTVNSSEFKSQPLHNMTHVLGGTNLERYKIKEGNKRKPNRYLPINDKRLLQKKNIFNIKRIVYQNIASSVPKIIATINSILPTDDTLNNLIVSDKSFSYEYILSILNSKLMTFYLRYAIINCSILTIHLDKSYLGKIPIKQISEYQQQLLIKLVDKMLSLHKRLNEIGDKKTDERARIEEEIKKIDAEIDEIVYKIYGITEAEKKIVEESLK